MTEQIPGTTITVDSLPPLVTRSKFWQMIADLPSTNFRIFVGVVLSVLFVVTVLGGILIGKIVDSNNNSVYVVGGFILLQMGLDVAQFKFKRDTYQAEKTTTPTTTTTKLGGGPDGTGD